MQPATATGALQQLQQFQAGAKSPDQMLQDAQSQLGVNAAQQQVQGLRGAIGQTTNLLNQVAPSVMGRTQNSLVTSAQANREIGNEQQPIQQNLSKLNTDYGNASQDYSNLENQANQRAQLGLSGQQSQQSYLQQIYSDLASQEQAQRDESFRQAQLAEQVAARKAASSGGGGLSLGGLSGGGGVSGSALGQGGGDPTQNAFNSAMDYAQKEKQVALNGTQVPTFFRESVLHGLQTKFGNQLPPEVLNDIIYKQIFPDRWAG